MSSITIFLFDHYSDISSTCHFKYDIIDDVGAVNSHVYDFIDIFRSGSSSQWFIDKIISAVHRYAKALASAVILLFRQLLPPASSVTIHYWKSAGRRFILCMKCSSAIQACRRHEILASWLSLVKRWLSLRITAMIYHKAHALYYITAVMLLLEKSYTVISNTIHERDVYSLRMITLAFHSPHRDELFIEKPDTARMIYISVLILYWKYRWYYRIFQ